MFSDSDGRDGSLTFTGTLADFNAALAIGVVFTTDTDFNGVDSLNVIADDLGNNGVGGPMVTTASIEIGVAAANDDPTANDGGAYAMDEDVPLTILAADLLSNDVDPDIATDGQALRVSSVSNFVNGTVKINGSGDVEFSANQHFSGLAAFD